MSDKIVKVSQIKTGSTFDWCLIEVVPESYRVIGNFGNDQQAAVNALKKAAADERK